MAIESWPAALRAHGIPVQLHNNFPNTPKPRGDMPDRIAAFFWHHDATPPGATPGGLSWMIDSYVKGLPCAQIWIDYNGVWHFVGAGYASHAGVVKGNLTSSNSVGAETDHTINETYPTVQLDSIRKGIAVCAIQEGRNADWMTFHKWEASPFGRKVDPWFDAESNDLGKWDDELGRERGIIQRYINDIKGGGELPPPITGDDELSAAEVQRIIDEMHFGFDKVMEGKNGEAPDHNIRQVKELLTEIKSILVGGMPSGKSNFHWLGEKMDNEVAVRLYQPGKSWDNIQDIRGNWLPDIHAQILAIEKKLGVDRAPNPGGNEIPDASKS